MTKPKKSKVAVIEQGESNSVAPKTCASCSQLPVVLLYDDGSVAAYWHECECATAKTETFAPQVCGLPGNYPPTLIEHERHDDNHKVNRITHHPVRDV